MNYLRSILSLNNTNTMSAEEYERIINDYIYNLSFELKIPYEKLILLWQKENKLKEEISHLTEINKFWNSISSSQKPTQLERYEKKGAFECIKKFIAIGGGPKMGTTLEQYARSRFKLLQKRSKGKYESGYDHLIKLENMDVLVEQKSSGHWGDDDYKWQHVEDKHKWNMLLLCGIDYTNVKFWGMNRETFNQMILNKRITNQGDKSGNSSEGMWFNYSDVKDFLVEIQTDDDLLQFALFNIK
jgi:hypothetical protein